MTDDEEAVIVRMVMADLTARSLVAWFAKNQEVGILDADQIAERLAEEAEHGDLERLLVPLIGNSALYLRLLAQERGLGLQKLIEELDVKPGMLGYLNVSLDEGEGA